VTVTGAPQFNSVNVLKGEVAERPSKFLAALSEADSLCRELDELRETQTRVQELAAENRELRDENLKLRVQLERAKQGRSGW